MVKYEESSIDKIRRRGILKPSSKGTIIKDRTARTVAQLAIEGFNDWGGRRYDDFVPWEVTKTAPSGDETT